MTLSHEATETWGCLLRWHGRVLHTSLSGTCRADPPWGGRALVPDSVSLPRGTHSRPRGRGAVPMSRPWALGGAGAVESPGAVVDEGCRPRRTSEPRTVRGVRGV